MPRRGYPDFEVCVRFRVAPTAHFPFLFDMLQTGSPSGARTTNAIVDVVINKCSEDLLSLPWGGVRLIVRWQGGVYYA